MKVRTPLSQGWTLRLNTDRGTPAGVPPQLAGTTVPAQVPGCVHTDLMAADLLADPYLDRNESEAAWVGRADWTYATELPRRDSTFERAELVFDGLDTVATVHAAGRLLGRTRNMHRSYRFDVTDLLADGPAPLDIAFTSAYTEAEAVREALGQRPNSYPEPFNYIRKMACFVRMGLGPHPRDGRLYGVRRASSSGPPPGWQRSVRRSPSRVTGAASSRSPSTWTVRRPAGTGRYVWWPRSVTAPRRSPSRPAPGPPR
ncbi:hypothetical protein SMICM304S_07310 [Streptomyces microflavus]